MSQIYLTAMQCRINSLLTITLKGIFLSTLFRLQPDMTFYGVMVLHLDKYIFFFIKVDPLNKRINKFFGLLDMLNLTVYFHLWFKSFYDLVRNLWCRKYIITIQIQNCIKLEVCPYLPLLRSPVFLIILFLKGIVFFYIYIYCIG